MIQFPLEGAIAALVVCCFILGIVVDRFCIWFHRNYIGDAGEEDVLVDDTCAVS